MYKVNETVIYGTEGICKITDIAERNFNSSVEKYYILKPLYNSSSTIMVPINNEILVSRMRRMLSCEEIEKLIEDMPGEEGLELIDDEKKRKEEYRGVILRGDRKELVKLIKTLYVHGENQKKLGKKLHACDERFFRDAEKMLYEEFAAALNIDKEGVLPFILSKIKKEEQDA